MNKKKEVNPINHLVKIAARKWRSLSIRNMKEIDQDAKKANIHSNRRENSQNSLQNLKIEKYK